MEIKLLPKSLRHDLRSGINIQSTAHCVTHLVLNSLDAKSTSVAVRVNLVRYKIQVIDNGSGITKKNFKFVGVRNATSKYFCAKELKKKQNVFGYRGEAIASIIKLSESVEIISRAGNGPNTYSITFKNGKYVSITNVTQRSSRGTTVIIEGFLYNMPIRQHFMNNNLCLEEIRKELEHIALIHPRTSFSLRNDCTGEVVFQTNKSKFVYQTFSNLYGKSVSKNLRKMKYKEADIFISGLIGIKNCYTQNNLQFVYVNKKYLKKGKLYRIINGILLKSYIFRPRDCSVVIKQSNNKHDSPSRNKENNAIFLLNVQCPASEYDIFDFAQIVFKNREKIFSHMEKALIMFLHKHNLIERPKSDTDLGNRSKTLVENINPLTTSQLTGVIRGLKVKRSHDEDDNLLNKRIENDEHLLENENNLMFLEKYSNNKIRKVETTINSASLGKRIIMEKFLKSTAYRQIKTSQKYTRMLESTHISICTEIKQQKTVNTTLYNISETRTMDKINECQRNRMNAEDIFANTPRAEFNRYARNNKEKCNEFLNSSGDNIVFNSGDFKINTNPNNIMPYKNLFESNDNNSNKIEKLNVIRQPYDRYLKTNNMHLNKKRTFGNRQGRHKIPLITKYNYYIRSRESTISHRGLTSFPSNDYKYAFKHSKLIKKKSNFVLSSEFIQTANTFLKRREPRNSNCKHFDKKNGTLSAFQKIPCTTSTMIETWLDRKKKKNNIKSFQHLKKYDFSSNDKNNFKNNNNIDELQIENKIYDTNCTKFKSGFSGKHLKNTRDNLMGDITFEFQPENCISGKDFIENSNYPEDYTRNKRPIKFLESSPVPTSYFNKINYNESDKYYDFRKRNKLVERTGIIYSDDRIDRAKCFSKIDNVLLKKSHFENNFTLPNYSPKNKINYIADTKENQRLDVNCFINGYQGNTKQYDLVRSNKIVKCPKERYSKVPINEHQYLNNINKHLSKFKNALAENSSKNNTEFLDAYKNFKLLPVNKYNYSSNSEVNAGSNFEETFIPYKTNPNLNVKVFKLQSSNIKRPLKSYSTTDQILFNKTIVSDEASQTNSRITFNSHLITKVSNRYFPEKQNIKQKATRNFKQNLPSSYIPQKKNSKVSKKKFSTSFKNSNTCRIQNNRNKLKTNKRAINTKNEMNTQTLLNSSLNVFNSGEFKSLNSKLEETKFNETIVSNPSLKNLCQQEDTSAQQLDVFKELNVSSKTIQENQSVEYLVCSPSLTNFPYNLSPALSIKDDLIHETELPPLDLVRRDSDKIPSNSVVSHKDNTTSTNEKLILNNDNKQNNSSKNPKLSKINIESPEKEYPECIRSETSKMSTENVNAPCCSSITSKNGKETRNDKGKRNETPHCNESCKEESEWIKQKNVSGSSFYVNSRTGMSSFQQGSKNTDTFYMTERHTFMPKGMSPIMHSTNVVNDKVLSPSSKHNLYQTIAKTKNDDLRTVKWMNYLESKDTENFFSDLYSNQKCYQTEIPQASDSRKNNIYLENFCLSKDIFNNIEVLNQWDYKFLVAKVMYENAVLLILFDQHAIHERIRLEKLLKEYQECDSEKLKNSKCIIPVILKVNNFDINMLTNYKDIFENWGVSYKIEDTETVVFTHIPTCWKSKEDSRILDKENSSIKFLLQMLIKEARDSLQNFGKIKAFLPTPIQNVIKMEACRGAIKFGDKLIKDNYVQYINDLASCNLPFQCAHGRPTMIPLLRLDNINLKKESTKIKFNKLKLSYKPISK